MPRVLTLDETVGDDMGMMQNQGVPNVPLAPREYDQAHLDALSNTLRLFFNNINAVQPLNLAALNFELSSLPTDADYNTLRLGDVYRNTQDVSQPGSNELRIKTNTNTVFLPGVSGLGSVGTVGRTNTVNLTGVSGAGDVGTMTP